MVFLSSLGLATSSLSFFMCNSISCWLTSSFVPPCRSWQVGGELNPTLDESLSYHDFGMRIADSMYIWRMFMIDYLNRFYLFCKEEPLWVVAFAFCGFINLTAYLTL